MSGSIAFVGGGVMGEAMIRGILNKQLVTPAEISVSDPLDTRRRLLQERYGVVVTAQNRDCVRGKEVVVLSVKPQNAAEAMRDLKGALAPDQLVLSIVAGVPIRTIVTSLAHGTVVRVMPNTPAQIGQGISVWTATPTVTQQQREWAQSILRTLGREIYIADEGYLDLATALSGTGPAYIFLFLEALIDAGVQIGFSRDISQQLVLQTALGSVLMLQETGQHPAELRNMVTSPGGTSAAALYEMEEGRIRAVVARAVVAACERSKALGREANQ